MSNALIFFQVVVLNCLSPSNITGCLDYNQWLPQYVNDYCRFRLHEPYSTEKTWLQENS